MKKIDRIIISHCEKLTDRLDYINKIIDIDFFKNRSDVVIHTSIDDQKKLNSNSYVYDYKWKQGLKNQEIFITEQMFDIYEKILSGGYENALILEDDFIICENFKDLIKTFESNLPNHFDCIFMSSCSNLETPKDFNGIFYESETSRCTCAYLVSKNFCEKILKNKTYFSPIDWHLNFKKNELNLKFFWTKEIYFYQGSEIKYKSNIR